MFWDRPATLGINSTTWADNHKNYELLLKTANNQRIGAEFGGQRVVLRNSSGLVLHEGRYPENLMSAVVPAEKRNTGLSVLPEWSRQFET